MVRDAIFKRVARRAGYHVVRADYYSPIPQLEELSPSLWTEPAAMPGVDLRLEDSLVSLETELAPHIASWVPANGWHPHNPMFGPLDAEVLYGLVRHLRPRRILEIGAGWSTLVIADAIDGLACEHESVDPFPSKVLDGRPVTRLSATDIPSERFAALEAGDILFIDTTHTVRPGGDVVHLLLGVLPTLAPGVVVQVHDFFRAFEYPRVLMERFGVYWQEHYLLQAMLADTRGWEVLFANHVLARLHGDRVRAVVPSLTEAAAPSSLWMRRLDPNA